MALKGLVINQSLSISCKSAHYLIVLFIISMLSVWQKGVDNVLAENELCVYLPILLWKKKQQTLRKISKVTPRDLNHTGNSSSVYLFNSNNTFSQLLCQISVLSQILWRYNYVTSNLKILSFLRGWKSDPEKIKNGLLLLPTFCVQIKVINIF